MSDQAFPQVVSGILSPGLSGLILAAVIAALMSSADTCLLSQSVILTQDIVRRFRPSSEPKTLLLTRFSLVTLGILALMLALALKQVYSSLMFAYTIFTCGLVVPVIAGFYKEKLRLTPQGALAALIVGGVVGLMGKFPGLDIPLKGDLGLIGFAVSAILLFGVSFITRKR